MSVSRSENGWEVWSVFSLLYRKFTTVPLANYSYFHAVCQLTFVVILGRINLVHVPLAHFLFGRFPEYKAATLAHFFFLPTDYEKLLKWCTTVYFYPANRNASKLLCKEREKLCSGLVNFNFHFMYSKNAWQLCQSTSLFLSPKTYKMGSSFSAHNFVHSFLLSGTQRYYLGCIANSSTTAVLNIT